MTREDLAFVADALLALCKNDREAPFYTEEGLRTRIQQAGKREPLFEQLAPERGDDLLLARECRAIIEGARLTHRQLTVVIRRLDGETFEQIGRQRGHSKQGAQSIFSQALKKIVNSHRVYPYAGLASVYRRETRRGRSGPSR